MLKVIIVPGKEHPVDKEGITRFLNSSRRDYDVIVVQVTKGDGLLALGSHFNAPVIPFSIMPPSTSTMALVGSPIFCSYMPHLYSELTDTIHLKDRVYNSYIHWLDSIAWIWRDINYENRFIEQVFPNSAKRAKYEEIHRYIPMVFLHSHPILTGAHAAMSNIIDVTGIQVAMHRKPLQPEVQAFLDGATEGVVYISLGEDRYFDGLHAIFQKMLIDSFDKFPNVRLMIRSKAMVKVASHKPEDVYFAAHFNQSDVLAHKNVRLFVTQGGVLSISGEWRVF